MSFVFLSFVCSSFPFCQFPCFSRYHAEPSLRPAPNASRISDPKSGIPEALTNSRQKLDVSINCHFFKNGDDNDEFSALLLPPSYSDNTTIMLAIVGRRPSPIPGACARERPAENR